MQLEPALICSRRFFLFLRTKVHINRAESSDISLQHLDVVVFHHLPCKIVLPYWRRGSTGKGQWTDTPVENIGNPTILLWWVRCEMNPVRCVNTLENPHFQICLNIWSCCQQLWNKKTIWKWYLYCVSQRLHLSPITLAKVSWENNTAFIQNLMLLVLLCSFTALLTLYGILLYNMRYCVLIKCLDKYRWKCKHCTLTEKFYRQKWCVFHSTVCSFIEVLLNKNKKRSKAITHNASF